MLKTINKLEILTIKKKKKKNCLTLLEISNLNSLKALVLNLLNNY